MGPLPLFPFFSPAVDPRRDSNDATEPCFFDALTESTGEKQRIRRLA